MNLDEWDKLTTEERSKVPLQEVLEVAALAAQALVESDEIGASSILIGDRFGETYFSVFTDDPPPVYANQTAYWHGFRLEFSPRGMQVPVPEDYRGRYYFEKLD